MPATPANAGPKLGPLPPTDGPRCEAPERRRRDTQWAAAGPPFFWERFLLRVVWRAFIAPQQRAVLPRSGFSDGAFLRPRRYSQTAPRDNHRVATTAPSLWLGPPGFCPQALGGPLLMVRAESLRPCAARLLPFSP